jgi:hypothetical protein
VSTDASPPPSYDPAIIAADLRAAVAEALGLFAGIDEDLSRVKPRPDAWCAREIVGHLIDSACNNHRRFVIGQSPGLARFDGYEQDPWVSRQHYADESWAELVGFWAAYNRHLMHVMRHTTAASAANGAMAPDGSGVVSVGFLMHDYVRHLRHHVEQVRRVSRH